MELSMKTPGDLGDFHWHMRHTLAQALRRHQSGGRVPRVRCRESRAEGFCTRDWVLGRPVDLTRLISREVVSQLF